MHMQSISDHPRYFAVSPDVLAPCFACEIRPLRGLGQVEKLLRLATGTILLSPTTVFRTLIKSPH